MAFNWLQNNAVDRDGNPVSSMYGSSSGKINFNQTTANVVKKLLFGGTSPAMPQNLTNVSATAHPTGAQFFGSGMGINPSTMSQDLKCQLDGSCDSSAYDPKLYTGSDYGSASMYGSSARRGNTDMKDTGIVPFTVQPSREVVTAGDGNDYEGQYKSQVDLSGVECVDCSAVDKDTFLEKCVLDKNVGYALMRFAQCNNKANRHVNQNSGSRQIEKEGERDGAAHNLTNPNNTDSSEGTNSAPGAGAMYGYGGLYGFGMAQSGSDNTLGGVEPANQQQNVGLVHGGGSALW
jgi:hypothetical protein